MSAPRDDFWMENAAAEALKDLATGGVSYSLDGKRVAPEDVLAPANPTEDEFMGWLDRAYNHPGNDARNFTRWNMQVAFNAGVAWARGRRE